jgi:hypothetical protein
VEVGSVDAGGQSGRMVFEQVVVLLSKLFPEDQSCLRQHTAHSAQTRRARMVGDY